MTVPASAAVPAAATGIAELGAEARRAHTSYREGALVAYDQVARIYSGVGLLVLEVVVLMGQSLLADRFVPGLVRLGE
jgi:hypothetical protein